MKFTKSISLAITGLLLAGGATSCKKSASDEVFNKIDLIPAKTSKKKWGFVDKNGKTVLEDEFAEAPTAVYNGLFSIEEKGGYTLYKMSGDEYKVVGECEKLKSVGYLEDGLIPMTFAHQRISVADESGKKKFDLNPVDGQEVVSCASGYQEGLLLFALEDGKMGYFDKKGNVAIKPIYSGAYPFMEGLALVKQTKEDSNGEEKTETFVINKKGEKVFTIKEDYYLNSDGFSNGYLYGKDDDKPILIDRKGEIKKLPSKINRIVNIQGSYIIFRDDDGQYGVADLEGEVIIRAKYDGMDFDGSDHFLGQRNDKVYRLDKEGKEIADFDFEYMENIGKFGYVVRDGNKWHLVDDKGKQKGKDDYYELSKKLAPSFIVSTDYFNVTDIAKKLVGLIDGNKIGSYELGTPASKFFAGKSPEDCIYIYGQVDLPDLEKEGFRYKISGRGLFTERLVDSEWDDYEYEYRYTWNPSSKLAKVDLILNAESEWGEDGFKALSAEIKNAGYALKKTGYSYGDVCTAVYTKGKIAVELFAPTQGDVGGISIIDTSIPNFKEEVDELINLISDTKPDYPAVEYADSAVYAATEEVIEVDSTWEPDYYY